MIGSEAYKVQVSTIHSFAQDVIKSFPEKFTQEKLDTPIDDIESMEIISEIVSDLLSQQKLEYLTSYGDTLFYVRAIKSAISNLKREGVSPQKFMISIEEETQKSLEWLEEKRNNKRIKKIENYEKQHEEKIGKLTELHTIFELYNQTLRSRHLYDFNDMINFVLEKFRCDEDLRAFFAETYQYIMLDEYQDTNNPQNEIINLILSYSDGGNIMVVWDDDQSIYRFQGANIENMLDFTSQYPDAKIIVLDKNYRSQQAILDAAASLIEHNTERLISRIPKLEKNLHSQRDFDLVTPSLYLAQSDLDEQHYIISQIEALLQKWIAPDEIAIIVRGNNEVWVWSELLGEKGIPVFSKLESNILQSDIISLLLSYFKVLENPYESETEFLNILRSSLSWIAMLDILRISNYLHRENYVRRGNKLKIFDVLRDHAALDIIWIEDSSKISEFVDMFTEQVKTFSDHNFIFAFSKLLRDFQMLEKSDGMNFSDVQDIYTLFHVIKWWSAFQQDISLAKVLYKIDLYKKYGYRIERIRNSGESSWVQVMTAHGSKWLEYAYVFIPGLYSGNWESKSVRELIKLPEWIAWDGLQFLELEEMSDAKRKEYEKQRQLEEDRRLFFVALTRAKKSLSLSFPASITGKVKIISSFLSELWELSHIPSNYNPDLHESDMKQEMLLESKYISYSESELEYIKSFLSWYKLSASDLNTFLLNPKDFLYRSIFKYPFEENENSIFGTMYHRTLELFYKKILETWEVQNYEYMEFVFLRQLEKEYLSSEERMRLKKRWLEALKGYYDCYNWSFEAPLKTEYKFSRRNIFFDGIPLTGIIDKIELLSDEFSANTSWWALFSQNIKITDYKTGSTKYIWEVKWQDKNWNPDEGYERGRYGRQLMFYKLLFENDHELSAQYNLEKLELDFCEGKQWKYKKLEVEFTDEEYQDFKSLLKETYEKMTSISFWREYLWKK